MSVNDKIKRFEDLIAWQKARKVTRDIYKATENEKFSQDFGLRNQIQRASVSIMSNIAEGFERRGNKEFLQFLNIAKASCAEVRSLLYVAIDNSYLCDSDFKKIMNLSEEVAKILGGLMTKVKKSI